MYGIKSEKKLRADCVQEMLAIIRCRIFCLVLYGCETWSLTLWEERKLRVFENMVLSKIFVPRRDEVTEEWRRLHNKELNNLYSSPNIVRVIKLIFKHTFADSFPNLSSIFCIVRVEWVNKLMSSA